MIRATRGIGLAALVLISSVAASSAAPPPLWDGFQRVKAPETGRAAVQLTTGKAFCYPLYYFIPTFTRDGRYLVHHRCETNDKGEPLGQVQLWRLDLQTGESVQLTQGNCPETRWKNWCIPAGPGVLDHRSALNVACDELIYFTGQLGTEVRRVNVLTLKDELLFELPEQREAVGQNCVTPDGRWFVYISSPRGSLYRQPVKDARVMAFNFDTREQRLLCSIDCHIHHVIAIDNGHFVFCHPPNGLGMLMTDLDSGKYVYLRDGDPGVPVPANDTQSAGHTCHFVATRAGIAYEAMAHKELGLGQRSGLYDPLTRRRFEFLLPPAFGYTHTGWDPEGRLWFYESQKGKIHDMFALTALDETRGSQWLRLCGNWPTFAGGQKAHFHPQLTPDRKWILMTGGDPETKTNHLFLLDVADLKDTRGITPERLSPTGASDILLDRFDIK